MTTTESPLASGPADAVGVAEAAHDDHVSDWVYVKVAAVLAVMTAIEVFMHFESVHQLSDTMITIILVVLMVLKFAIVAAYFMHLKYDNAWFTKMLGAGLVLAYPVYMIMAYALGFLEGWSWVAKVALLALPTIIGSIWLLFAWKGGDAQHADHPHDDTAVDASDAQAVTEATH
jgi:cytochrome c oxidase subunit IV